jgi:hypothetical protein
VWRATNPQRTEFEGRFPVGMFGSASLSAFLASPGLCSRFPTTTLSCWVNSVGLAWMRCRSSRLLDDMLALIVDLVPVPPALHRINSKGTAVLIINAWRA